MSKCLWGDIELHKFSTEWLFWESVGFIWVEKLGNPHYTRKTNFSNPLMRFTHAIACLHNQKWTQILINFHKKTTNHKLLNGRVYSQEEAIFFLQQGSCKLVQFYYGRSNSTVPTLCCLLLFPKTCCTSSGCCHGSDMQTWPGLRLLDEQWSERRGSGVGGLLKQSQHGPYHQDRRYIWFDVN